MRILGFVGYGLFGLVVVLVVATLLETALGVPRWLAAPLGVVFAVWLLEPESYFRRGLRRLGGGSPSG